MTAISVDAALSLIAYYTGRGRDVDLDALPYGDLERATLQLALLVRRCLGQTDDERHSELGRLSLHLQLRSDLDHPHAVDLALTLLSSVVATDDDRAAARVVLGLPVDARVHVCRRLAWLAYSLLGDDDNERMAALAHVSLTLQLVALDEGL